ncbi:MucR family transcriptional regulator [Sphingomonas sp. PAMC 26605]|uniref:MucR family transcriptional regulator n=1 Tax=Sphingomonas sp. PAMC 26605 TaxID=1112214 RepID=UPI00026CB1EF
MGLLMADQKILQMTTFIVAAMVSNNRVASDDLPSVIASVYQSLSDTHRKPEVTEVAPKPAVAIRASVRPDSLTCLECGGIFRSLKRHLRTVHDISPEGYRAKWSLPVTYPMVAPDASAERSRASKARGFGLRPSVQSK